MREISDLTYYQENRDLILNKGKDYYKNNKVRVKDQTRDKYLSAAYVAHKRRRRAYQVHKSLSAEKKLKTDTKRIPKRISK